MAIDQYNAARAEVAKAVAAARLVMREAFNEGAKEILTENPRIHSFRWTQYTPYFNDGDECVFSVHWDYPEINEMEEWDVDHLDRSQIDAVTEMALPGEKDRLVPPTPEDFATVSRFLQQFDEEDMRSMFGDHKEITVSADGITDVHYDHD